MKELRQSEPPYVYILLPNRFFVPIVTQTYCRHLLFSFLIAVGTATTVAYTLPRTRLLSVGVCTHHMMFVYEYTTVCWLLYLVHICTVMDTLDRMGRQL